MQPVLCIVGPTASGKSELADELAVRLGSAVISVDAFQVYRGMDIGTAKEPPASRRAPLLMVDVCDITTNYSAQLFQHDARAYINTLHEQGKLPVLCGGTGLYLDAVVDEMSFASGTKEDDKRSYYNELAESKGAQYLHSLLQIRDPESADLIHPNNARRTIRALEMCDAGESYAQNHEGLLARKPHYQTLMFCVSRSRKTLYERINTRVDLQFERGLVDEVRQLMEQGLTSETTAAQGIGYKEVIDALEGRCTLDEAREAIKLRTRHYAKRQLSWIKRDGRAHLIDRDSLTLEQAADKICEAVTSTLHLELNLCQLHGLNLFPLHQVLNALFWLALILARTNGPYKSRSLSLSA